MKRCRFVFVFGVFSYSLYDSFLIIVCSMFEFRLIVFAILFLLLYIHTYIIEITYLKIFGMYLFNT